MLGVNRWLAAILALVLLYLIRGILAPFAVAAILAYVFVPGIDWLAARFRVRRAVVVVAIYILFLAVLSGLVYAILPTIRQELVLLRTDSVQVVTDAIKQLIGGDTVDVLGTPVRAHEWAFELVSRVRSFLDSPESALQLSSSVLTRAGEVALALITLFYLLLDWEKLVAFAFRFVPVEERLQVGEIAQRIHQLLGRYIRGELVLIVFVASLTWIFLSFVFHLPLALIIAVATGLLEIIPLIGPVTAGAIAGLVAVSKGGPNLALQVIIFYIVLRQVEDWFIMPYIVGRAVHLHPAVTLFAALAGGALVGPLGLLLGVPAAAAINVMLQVTQPAVEKELKANQSGQGEQVISMPSDMAASE